MNDLTKYASSAMSYISQLSISDWITLVSIFFSVIGIFWGTKKFRRKKVKKTKTVTTKRIIK